MSTDYSFDGSPVGPREDCCDRFQALITYRPRAGFERAPMRSYRVIQEGRFLDIHEGRGLTVDQVIEQEWSARALNDGGHDYDRDPCYDLAVFEGLRLVAVVHCYGAPADPVRVTRFGPDGRPEPS